MFATMLEQKSRMITADKALPGRATPLPVPAAHFVNGRALRPPYPEGFEVAEFGLGCFWGAERRFWQTPGVWVTAVGYAGGFTPNPDYKEVCSGLTGHAEVVRLVFDPREIGYADLLKIFWEVHDPTQGMRQGGDIGTQYRSVIHTLGAEQQRIAEATRAAYQDALRQAGRGTITTVIVPAGEFYFAEDYHQQYLAKNPEGYCGLGGTGVSCPG